MVSVTRSSSAPQKSAILPAYEQPVTMMCDRSNLDPAAEIAIQFIQAINETAATPRPCGVLSRINRIYSRSVRSSVKDVERIRVGTCRHKSTPD